MLFHTASEYGSNATTLSPAFFQMFSLRLCTHVEEAVQNTCCMPIGVFICDALFACVGLLAIYEKLHVNVFGGSTPTTASLAPLIRHLDQIDMGQGLPYKDYKPHLDLQSLQPNIHLRRPCG